MIEYIVRTRTVDDITIIFYKNDELIVRQGKMDILFHHWFQRNRKYSFRPFAKELMYKKNINRHYIFEKALSHGVDYVCIGHNKADDLLLRVEKVLPVHGETQNAQWGNNNG